MFKGNLKQIYVKDKQDWILKRMLLYVELIHNESSLIINFIPVQSSINIYQSEILSKARKTSSPPREKWGGGEPDLKISDQTLTVFHFSHSG